MNVTAGGNDSTGSTLQRLWHGIKTAGLIVACGYDTFDTKCTFMKHMQMHERLSKNAHNFLCILWDHLAVCVCRST
jgi:hypothetical protein